MKNKPKIVKLPVSYAETAFDDERFMKLRVKVMHSGLNLNNSNFDLEAINNAQATLANIPLLAFIKKTDGDSNADFAGHEYEIKITEDDVKYVYLGRPIGIVPESNNYAIETDEETGKTFVVVDAYVWRDYANSALDILNRDMVKKVSMEIIVDDYEWEDSYVDIKGYKYTGIALLGEDVREAMIGANAEIVQFSEDSISEMMIELKKAMANFSLNEPEVDESKTDETFNDESVVVDDTVNADDSDADDKDEYVDDNFDDSQQIVDNDDDDDDNKDFSEEEVGNQDDTKDDEEFNVNDDESDESIPEGNEEPNEFEIKIADLEKQIEDFENTIATLETENKELKEFKEQIELKEFNAQKEALFNDFDDLTEEEIAPLKDAEFSLEELEVRLYALRGRKVSPNKEGKRVGIDALFTKPIDSSREPIYADLVKKNIKK
jgi:hypothetical protein